jgi:hypothetical protein
MMPYLQRRTIEKVVRRFCRCHLDAQAATAEVDVESESSDPFWQSRCEGERSAMRTQTTEARD